MAPLVVDPCGYLNPTTRWDTAPCSGPLLNSPWPGLSLWVPEIVSWLVRRHVCIR